jgi:hypothetical protein
VLLVIGWGKFVVEPEGLLLVGVIILITASLWNAWLIQKKDQFKGTVGGKMDCPECLSKSTK